MVWQKLQNKKGYTESLEFSLILVLFNFKKSTLQILVHKILKYAQIHAYTFTVFMAFIHSAALSV